MDINTNLNSELESFYDDQNYDLERALQETDSLLRADNRYKKSGIIGFHNTYPHPLGIKIYQEAMKYNPNNLGLHTQKIINSGFAGSNSAEILVIKKLSEIFGGVNKVDGYISPGGTEANIVSLWAARNKFKSKNIAIICSFLTHYSVSKAVDLLGIETSDGGGLHFLGTDQNGHLIVPHLKQKMKKVFDQGVDGIVIVANAGTTMLGAIDDIAAINETIKNFKKEYSYPNVHFHVDAAFGGMIIPFLDQTPKIGFENSELDSMTVDMHKMGLAPFGSGIIMMKHNLFDHINTKGGYVKWEDCTLCGSRPGASALACHALLNFFGSAGYKNNAMKVMQLASFVKEEIHKMGLTTFTNDINIISVKDKGLALWKELNDIGYRMHCQEFFPINLSKPHVNLNDSIWNIVITPSMNYKFLTKFLEDLREIQSTINEPKRVPTNQRLTNQKIIINSTAET